MQPKEIIVICGPTASGKSYLGHHLAKKLDGEIVNCDSMQIYQQIPIITSSPPQIYREEIPYHLYNFFPIEQEFSLVKYVKFAYDKIEEIIAKQKIPIIVGGTGLYTNSLLFGYNEIPEIASDIRQNVRKLYTELGQAEFFSKLQSLDSIAGMKLKQGDTQRVIRAYEVFLQTEKSIFTFQAAKNIDTLSHYTFKVIFLHPERKFLYHTCDTRLEKIFVGGAIDEIAALHSRFPNLNSSAMKTIGVREIISYLVGKNDLQNSLSLAQAKTRQYAKRQITWFKNQIKDKITLEYSDNKQFEELVSKVVDDLNTK